MDEEGPKAELVPVPSFPKDIQTISGQNPGLGSNVLLFLFASYSPLLPPVCWVDSVPPLSPAWTNCLMLVSTLEK